MVWGSRVRKRITPEESLYLGAQPANVEVLDIAAVQHDLALRGVVEPGQCAVSSGTVMCVRRSPGLASLSQTTFYFIKT